MIGGYTDTFHYPWQYCFGIIHSYSPFNKDSARAQTSYMNITFCISPLKITITDQIP